MDQLPDVPLKPSVTQRVLKIRERMKVEDSSSISSDTPLSTELKEQDRQDIHTEIDEMTYEAWDENFVIDRWRDWTLWEQWSQWGSH